MSILYTPEPERHHCPQHAELYSELVEEDLINYAHTTGCCAGQLDKADKHRGFTSDRSVPIRGGFRFHGEAEQTYIKGYLEELNGLTHSVEELTQSISSSTQLDMGDI